MKFLKGIFPSGKKTIGFILMAAIGVMVWNVVNAQFRIERKVNRFFPNAENQNMKKAV